MSIYVTMKDTFMSGWGQARNKTNIYMVKCDTLDQAKAVERNGLRRDEMKFVKIRGEKKPYYNPRTHLVSEKHVSELGPVWTDINYGEHHA